MDNSFPGKDITSSDLIDKFPLAAKKAGQPYSKIKVDNVTIGGDETVVMAGPNVVESLGMMLEIAEQIKQSNAHILRGGAYKPLTFPYRSEKYFETGIDGLKWLQKAGQEFSMPTVSEATSEENVDEVANYVSMIQIGTRNMQNFNLLKKAARTMKPILLKRGFGNSLRDFLGAAEYILNEGNSNIILCERGVVAPHTHRATSRFLLDLQIVPAIKEVSHLPIITDPSHATFWAPWVNSMALASIAAGAAGIMIEVHPDPKNAAVDPLQPLNYHQFKNLMKSVNILDSVKGSFILN